MDPRSGSASVRRAIRVRGVVQGVGFRPAMVRLARRVGIAGFVRNDSEGVWMEIEGAPAAIERFVSGLCAEAPPLARIASVELDELDPLGEREFLVRASAPTELPRALAPADAATCEACLRELFDPTDRRYRYPFINCTDCGPRFTIIADLSYDRERTTMRQFRMCAACSGEYEDPANRRYHAEPNACPACGPRVTLNERDRVVAGGDEAVEVAARYLRDGRIVAVKGLGGYQLAVAAGDRGAVGRLRERKHRPHKPFALMARDLGVAGRVAVVDDLARRALCSSARPIVVLPSRPCPDVADNVAPGLGELGLMLPATPLHHLLLRAGPPLLVMTSGNRGEEPIAIDERGLAEAVGAIADVALVHDRPVHTRADDSVVRPVRGAMQPVRRARGFVPECFALSHEGPAILAVGPHLKSTICLTRGREACVSQHIGDLDALETRAFFEETISKLSRLLGVRPTCVAHDLHPGYASTAWASESGLPRVAVQHHHAHVAACLVEHGRSEAVLGVAFDGTGCGPAGELWGGEFLVADLEGFSRIGHLRALPLPGGEAAIRAPWRLALSAQIDAGEPAPFPSPDVAARSAVEELLRRDVACVPATGAGRWFDAVAAILGVRDVISYEGQAAVELEALASRGSDTRPYPLRVQEGTPFEIDLRPLVRAVCANRRLGLPSPEIALRFHATMAEAIVEGCRRGRASHGVNVVALSGGCFQNRILTEQACALLERERFEVLVHQRVPPNDGGLSLGQAAVAQARLRAGKGTRQEGRCAWVSPVR